MNRNSLLYPIGFGCSIDSIHRPWLCPHLFLPQERLHVLASERDIGSLFVSGYIEDTSDRLLQLFNTRGPLLRCGERRRVRSSL